MEVVTSCYQLLQGVTSWSHIEGRRSEAALMPGKHVEVSPGITRVSVARLTRQRHHSDEGIDRVGEIDRLTE